MQIWHAIVLGIVEGMTEFVPLSSTFHLLFTERLLGLPKDPFLDFFTVIVQGAAILPVIWLGIKDWKDNPLLAAKVLAAFLPTAVVGFLAYSLIKETFFNSPISSVVIFMLVGVLFLILERYLERGDSLQKTVQEISWPLAGAIGLAQSLAIFPGVSRSGSILLFLLIMGFRRDEAAKFSFYVGVPTILMASGYDLYKSRELLFLGEAHNLVLLAVGSLFAFLSSVIVVNWFLGFLRTKTLHLFGWYRIIVGALLLVWLLALV